MSDELNLTLPERKAPQVKKSHLNTILLCVAILLLAAVIVLNLTFFRGVGGSRGIPPEKLKDLAVKLEQQGIKSRALGIWREYLSLPGLSSEERAKVWYRVGVLEQEAGDDEAALEAFYRSEAEAALKDLAPEIAIKVQESLERSGKFASLHHELKDRTSTGVQDAGKGGGVIVAEIGPRKVTLEELDRRIEKMIDLQLDQFASAIPADERAKQREALLKRFSTPEARAQELRRFLMEEVLTRKAREDKLQSDPAVQDLLRVAERQILASKEMGRELSSKINITESDIKNFYEAHKSEYKEKKEKEPERQKSFEEARPEVYSALRRQKEMEIQEELLKSLEKKYDVVIHNDALK